MVEYELTPSPNGCDCIGNGLNPDVECQCDECPHFQECFPPSTKKPVHYKEKRLHRGKQLFKK